MITLLLLQALSLQTPAVPAQPSAQIPTQRPLESTASQVNANSRELLLELFAEAEKKYLEKDYAGALAVFARAYEQSQDPTCLANMARIHEDLGEYNQAAELYQRFLRHPLASPTDRDTIARRLDRLPGATPAPAVVPSPKPTIRPPPPPPPPPKVRPRPEPAPTVTREPPAPSQPRARPLLISGGVAIALSAPPLIASAIYFERAGEIHSTLDVASYNSHEQRKAASEHGRNLQWIAIGTATAGGALFLTGVVLSAVGSHRARATARALQRAALGLNLQF